MSEWNHPWGEVLGLRQDGAVCTLTLQRPRRFNALSPELVAALQGALALVAARDDVRALVLTGAGPAFCSGADLAGGKLNADPVDPAALQQVGERVRDSLLTQFNPLVQQLAELPQATVCAVNGMTAGGGVGLALACDIVLAARSAQFVQVFAPRLGLVPDCGVTWQLPRTVGKARALALALLGEALSAEEAERLGLIWRAVDDAALPEQALRLAQRLAANPAHVNRQVKAALQAATGHSLAEQLALEAELQGACAALPSFTEGVSAFLQKREPDFHRNGPAQPQ